jgi:hypothetical protein
MEDLVIGWVQSVNERSEVFNFRTCTDDPNDSLPDLQLNGCPIWSAEDPVHVIPDLYSEAAATIMGAISSDSGDFEAQVPAKRQRLESVIVRRAGESSKPRGKPAAASWSTGTLPPPRGKGWRGRPMRGRFMRGSWQGGKWPPEAREGACKPPKHISAL